MIICTIDKKDYNLELSFTVNMEEKRMTYMVVAWDKKHHILNKYPYYEGQFEVACNRFERLKAFFELRENNDNVDFLDDLHAEQIEQM